MPATPPIRFARTPGQSHAHWTVDPTVPLPVPTTPLPDGYVDHVERARAVNDHAALRLILQEATVTWHPDLAAIAARTLLDANQNTIPDITTGRLHANVMGGTAWARTQIPAVVGDALLLADALEDEAAMYALGLAVDTNRADGGASLAASISQAIDACVELVALLRAFAGGQPFVAHRLMHLLSVFALTPLSYGISSMCSSSTGIDGLRVTYAAQMRHQVGSRHGLDANLDVLADDPGNIAARTSACACLVDLGQPEAGLDHLAVALLDPDSFSANALGRALRLAHYTHLADAAERLKLLVVCGPDSEAKVLASKIMTATGRREFAEVALSGLTAPTSRVFAARVALDRTRTGQAVR